MLDVFYCDFLYPDVVNKVATAAILIQTRGVQSMFSLEFFFIKLEMIQFVLHTCIIYYICKCGKCHWMYTFDNKSS